MINKKITVIIFVLLGSIVTLFSQTPSKTENISESLFDKWSKAGISKSIAHQVSERQVIQIDPSYNLQLTINELSQKGGGILLLNKGKYVISTTIKLESGVILRGCNRDSVLLSVKIHGFHFSTGKPRQSALYVGHKQKVGIENLTIKYTAAGFEPLDKDSMTAPWDKAVFHLPELRDTSLFVEHIWIDGSENCWVKNCNLLCSGNDPLLITNSKYITCCNNYIDRSYNKCDGGMGYYDITNSSYVLIHHERIRRIRHFAIQKGSNHNVIINNYFEVDVNFHDGDLGNNLIGGNTIRIPEWHSWDCFSRGDPNQHRPPGENNILFNNDAVNKTGKAELSETNQVYLINSIWPGGKAFPIDLKKSDKEKLNHFIYIQYSN